MTSTKFDVYRTVIEDTSQLSARRQTLDNVYVTIVTLVLAADGYVAGSSRFSSWFPVIVSTGISIVGINFTLHWRRVLGDLKEVLRFRYKWLTLIESDPELSALGADVYTQEDRVIYEPRTGGRAFGFGARIQHLQTIFVTVFVLIPFLLALATLVASVPNVHPFIQPLVAR